MNMNKEKYERLNMDVLQFEAEDIISTSVEGPSFSPSQWEIPLE